MWNKFEKNMCVCVQCSVRKCSLEFFFFCSNEMEIKHCKMSVENEMNLIFQIGNMNVTQWHTKNILQICTFTETSVFSTDIYLIYFNICVVRCTCLMFIVRSIPNVNTESKPTILTIFGLECLCSLKHCERS